MDAQPILFCSHVADWGGAETVLADLLTALDRRRFAPHLLLPADGPLAQRARDLDITVHRIAIGGRNAFGKAASLFGAVRAIRRLANRTGARLCYANTMIAGYAGVMAQRHDLACLWHVHVVTRSRIARRFARRAAAVVVPSQAAAAALQRGSVHVVRNGVPDSVFEASGTGLRGQLGLGDDVPLVGVVGRIDPHKGHAVLLRACARPGARFHVAIVGGESFAASQARVRGHAAELRELAARSGIAERVHFLGHRDDIAAVMAQLDIVAVPSVAAESAPRSIAEAQAAGRPVIASDVGGVREMIRDGITGRLCAAGDPEALGRAIDDVLGDAEKRAQLGEAARRHAMAQYSMRTFVDRIETICQRTLDRIADHGRAAAR